MPSHLKLFYYKEEGMFPNSFYEASIILIPETSQTPRKKRKGKESKNKLIGHYY